MEESKELNNQFDYRSMPTELKTMVLNEAMSEKIVTVWKNHILDAVVLERSLLRVNVETRDIVTPKENDGSVIELGRFPDVIDVYAGGKEQAIRLDLESATLKIFEMELPTAEVRTGEIDDPPASYRSRSTLPLPFRRVMSISKKGWKFPWIHDMRGEHPAASTAERLRAMPLKSWPAKARLPLVKEVTFVTRFGNADFSINGFQQSGVSSDRLAGCALGSHPEKGIWLGFRYFKETGRIQFTPLIADEVSFAISEAKKIYRNRLPHYDVDNPLVIKVSLIERGESPVDEPYHMWTDLREPDQNDTSWVQQACTAWKFARESWLVEKYAETVLYCANKEEVALEIDDLDEDGMDEGSE